MRAESKIANQMIGKKVGRNSMIELLRIISMLMIILSHYTVHNGVLNSSLPLGVNRFLLEFSTLGNIGVIIFVLITGYFLGNDKKPLQIQKLAKIVLQVIFYSAGIYLVLCAIGVIKFDLHSIVRALFPITFKKYWFASAYVVLYIFHPYVNKLLNILSRKEQFRLILTMMVFFSIARTITTGDFYGNELVQFMLFYIIGDYLRKYKDCMLANRKWRSLALVISIVVVATSIIALDLLGSKTGLFNNHSTYLLSRTSPFAIVIAVSVFCAFAYRKPFSNKGIDAVALSTFGVYLIHDNPYMREVIWCNLLHNSDYVSSNWLFVHIIISVISVFVVCSMIELARLYFIDSKLLRVSTINSKKTRD